MKRPIILACALLAACDGGDPVASGANDTAALPDVATNAPDPTGAPPANVTAEAPADLPQGANPPPAGPAKIPAALHGRWGLTPGDCTSTRGDNKGLLTITADGLTFYESRGVPDDDVAVDGNSVRGDFNFTGEGQTWTRFQSLRLQGRDLVRTESNPTASYSYAKCT